MFTVFVHSGKAWMNGHGSIGRVKSTDSSCALNSTKIQASEQGSLRPVRSIHGVPCWWLWFSGSIRLDGLLAGRVIRECSLAAVSPPLAKKCWTVMAEFCHPVEKSNRLNRKFVNVIGRKRIVVLNIRKKKPITNACNQTRSPVMAPQRTRKAL